MTCTIEPRLSQTDVVSRFIGELTITLLPARGYEVRPVAGRASLGVPIEMQREVDAISQSRVRPFVAAAYTLAWVRTSLSEIALACGFSPHAHVTKACRAHFGCSPRSMR